MVPCVEAVCQCRATGAGGSPRWTAEQRGSSSSKRGDMRASRAATAAVVATSAGAGLTHYFCVRVILENNPLSLYALSSSEEVCSLSGCFWAAIARRGSDSTMILSLVGARQVTPSLVDRGSLGTRHVALEGRWRNGTYSKSSSLSDDEAVFSKQNEYSPSCN